MADGSLGSGEDVRGPFGCRWAAAVGSPFERSDMESVRCRSRSHMCYMKFEVNEPRGIQEVKSAATKGDVSCNGKEHKLHMNIRIRSIQYNAV